MRAAILLFKHRQEFDDGAILEVILWKVDSPIAGSAHPYKYRLFYGYAGERVIGYDNERPKGDHRHYRERESAYTFVSPERLIDDFLARCCFGKEQILKTATIVIRKPQASLASLRTRFRAAWKTGKYQGENFEFESPAALFRTITPKRWELIEVLQLSGPLGVRALARELDRDVKRVHEDAHKLVEIGLVEKDAAGKLSVPFAEIRADFVLRSAA